MTLDQISAVTNARSAIDLLNKVVGDAASYGVVITLTLNHDSTVSATYVFHNQPIPKPFAT